MSTTVAQKQGVAVPDLGPEGRTPRALERTNGPGPLARLVLQIGGMLILTGQTLRRAVRPPFNYGPELVSQISLTIRLGFFPLILVSFALSFGPAGVQASDFFGLFGAFDRMGSAWQIVMTRFFAPMTTAIVLAGVAGTAICADLGARVIREEMDALRVLGVDVVKSLVVPRLLVLTFAAFVFDAFAMLSGMLGAVLVLVQHGQPIGPFFHEYFAAANMTELIADFIQAGIYGAVIAIVSCYKGMTVSGGPEGVGRAVNNTVVVCFLAVGAIAYAFEAFVLATNPLLSIPRG